MARMETRPVVVVCVSLVLLLLKVKYTEGQCTNTTNCATCDGAVCTSCKAGYYHTTSNPPCSNECQDKCKTCTGNNNCQSCNDNYYLYNGRYCNSCPTKCALCTTYETCTQCEEGWANGGSITNCDISCSTQCTDCSCTSCKSGWYGPTCASECQASCAGSCDKDSGVCDECVPGRYGELCQYSCPEGCSSTTCDKDTGNCLTCLPTYYGSLCQYRCSPLCDGQLCGEDGFCTSCPDGKYGQYCSSDCPGSCTKCDQQTGACDSDNQCQSGYYGDTCGMVCQRCESTCNKQGGACHVCEEGYTGANCDKQCHIKCKVCYRNSANTCSACADNWYGYSSNHYNCNSKCSSQCLVETCDDKTGKCNACPDDYSGDQCNFKCYTKCKSCDQLDPTSCTACPDSTYGYENNRYTCEHQCSTNCKDGQCDDQTGVCSQGCIAGYAGQTCLCPENCNCDGADGTVCTSCKDGTSNTEGNCVCSTALCSDDSCTSCSNSSYYGTGTGCCLCSQRCKDQKCVSQDVCSNGCENGFYKSDCSGTCTEIDPQCDICTIDQQSQQGIHCSKCMSKYFRDDTGTCVQCSNDCSNANCSSETGHCVQGCSGNTWGERCTQSCSSSCNGCEQSDGKCDACLTNIVHGDYCNSSCSDGCIENRCDKFNATCLKGCRDGFYGDECHLECSKNCVGEICNRDNGGYCTNGCYVGFHGAKCDQTCSENCVDKMCNRDNGYCTNNGCSDGFHGDDCTLACSQNCANKTCDRVDGDCSDGCKDGYEGSTCTKAQAAIGGDGEEGGGAGAAIGGAIGAVVVIAIIVVLVFIFIRRRKSNDQRDENEPKDNKTSSVNMSHIDSDVHVYNEPGEIDAALQSRTSRLSVTEAALETDADDALYAMVNKPKTVTNGHGSVVSTRPGNQATEGIPYETENDDTYYNSHSEVNKAKIAVDKLAAFVEEKNPDYFKEEFETFPMGLIKPYVDSKTSANLAKNRYKGLYPYDDCRVKVAGGDTDYINASYIDGYKTRHAYIASLGPMKKQMGDYSVFWRMIWQQDVEIIVMLTNLREDGTIKCEQYWPDIGSEKTYSGILVTSHTEDEYAEFVLRSFTLKKGSKQRTVHQLHYTAWPDKGTPDDVTGLVEFRQKVLNMQTKLAGPTLVHCSAGVGRTGTYIGLDILTKEGQAEKMVDIPGCVRNMRQNRIKMVQTWDQYQYLHNAVVHSLTFDCKPIQTETFKSYMANTQKSQLDTLYKKLGATVEKHSEDETKAVAKNKKLASKNRQAADIPGDAFRPRLYLGIQHGGSDYINAVYINSHRTQMRYLVAQSPLPGTVQDFLSLAYQENCSCLVSFEAPGSDTNQDIGVYYPADNQTLKQGKFSVSCTRNDTTKYSVQRKLNISYNGKEKVLPHLQFTDWDAGRNVPKSASNFLQFINEVETEARKSPDNGPVMIHCRDGAGKSGLFCVVAVLLQKIEIEHEVSIVNTVRQVKSRRRLAIPNKEQFHFCYGCIQEYLTSFDIYSNFVLKG